MTTNKVSSESPFYFQLIHVNNIWNIKTVFMQNGYRMQWYGIFPPFLIRYLAQLGLLHQFYILNSPKCARNKRKKISLNFLFVFFYSLRPLNNLSVMRDGSSWVEQALSYDKCSCSRTQHSDDGEARTRGPSVSSRALYH